MYKKNTKKIIRIFNFLNKQSVPLLYSIPLCLKLMGVQMKELSKTIGITRDMFYKIIAGERTPNEKFKEELNALGINPWEYN